MVTFRDVSSDFQIDGISMPIPNEFTTDTQIISTEDSGRLAGNGAMQTEFLTHVFVTTWKYKFMTGDEYDTVYKQYIENTIKNKNMYHKLKTINSNNGKSLNYDIYTQDEMKSTLIKLNTKDSYYMALHFVNGVRMYQDVTFTFIGIGGDEYVSA